MTDVYENRASQIWKQRTDTLMASFGMAGVTSEKYDPSGLEEILKEKSASLEFSQEGVFNGRRALTESGREDEESVEEEQQQRPLLNPDSDASPKVCVVASEETGRTPPYQKLLFRTYRTAVVRSRAVSDCELWEAGRATSAAPSYFPPHQLADGRVWCDGGIVANNPVKTARDEAADIWPGRKVGLIVSLGCGAAEGRKIKGGVVTVQRQRV